MDWVGGKRREILSPLAPPHPITLPQRAQPHTPTSKHPIHRLMRQLDPQESRRIRRHRPRHRRREPRKKSPEPPIRVQAPNRATDRRPTFRALQPALDGIDGEDGDPHGDAGARPRDRHGRETELALRLAGDGVFGRQPALHVLVGGEISGGAGPVAGEGHGGAAEDAFDAAFGVELADDVEAVGVAGFLAGGEGFLALDLEEHFDALEGGGDEGHGDGGEEAGGGDLGDGEWGGGGGVRGEAADEGFAHVIALR